MRNIKFFTLLGIAAGLFLFSGGLSNTMCQMKPIKFEKDTLANGLQVIYQVDKSAPVIATVVHYRVGSRDESPSHTGYAHFFEHLMFEATTNIPRASVDKYVEEAGGDLNAHTSFDETVFFFRLPSNEINLALWIESQRMRGLLVDPIGVETQRGVVTEEMKMRRENAPYGTLLDKLCEHGFPGGSYSWTTIGAKEHIQAATKEDFRSFYNNFYQPNNATLVIAGDFDLEQTKKSVDAYFGILPKGTEPKREPFKIQNLEKEYREVIVDEKAQLPAVFMGFRGPALSDKDYFAVSLLTDILAAGESSRLYQAVVDKEQVGVQAGADPLILEKAGMILVYAVAQHDKEPKDCENVIMKEINNIAKKGITDEELTKAKNIKEAQFIFEKKGTLDKAQTLARYNSYYGDPSLINTEIEHFLKVTKEDIVNVAKKYFATDKKVVLYYIPKK